MVLGGPPGTVLGTLCATHPANERPAQAARTATMRYPPRTIADTATCATTVPPWTCPPNTARSAGYAPTATEQRAPGPRHQPRRRGPGRGLRTLVSRIERRGPGDPQRRRRHPGPGRQSQHRPQRARQFPGQGEQSQRQGQPRGAEQHRQHGPGRERRPGVHAEQAAQRRVVGVPPQGGGALGSRPPSPRPAAPPPRPRRAHVR